jgi:hypothetical protein
MTDYAADLFDASAAGRPKVEPVAGTPDYAEELFGGGRGKAPSVADKDLTYDYDRTLGFKQQAVGSFASDDNEWLRHAAKSLYPDEPLEKAVTRFGKTKEGRYFHKGDDGKAYEVTPPKGIGRLANIGGGVGHALPIGGGTAAGVVTAPMAATGVGLVGTMSAAAGGAVVGETLRQKIGDYILGEASTNELNVPKVLYEGAQSGLGQGVGAGFASWMQRHAVPDIGRYSATKTSELLDKADDIGVRLTPAESTGLASLAADQKRLSATPQSANLMKEFAEERNAEVYGAYQTFLNRLGVPRDPAALAKSGSEAAENVLANAQKLRTGAVDPFYKQAEAEIRFASPRAAHEYIRQETPAAKGAIASALREAETALKVNGAEASDASFKGLNNAKMAIDNLINFPDIAARKGIDRSAFHVLEEVRDRLVTALDNAPGSTGAYAKGRETYANLSKNLVEPTEEALTPLLNAGRSNANLVQTAQALLDPAQRSPLQIAQARRLIERQDPQLWNSFVRQFLQQETAGALKTMASGEMRNVGGGISTRLSSEPMMENIRAAMNPRQFKEFSDVMDVFKATARAVDMNSDTAFKAEALKRARIDAGGIPARIARNANPVNWPKGLEEWFTNRRFDKQAEALARIITSGDRQAITRIRQLKNLDPGDYRRLSVLGEVLVRSGAYGAEEALD